MKKKVLIAVVIFALLACFAGCVAEPDETPSPTPSEVVSETPSPSIAPLETEATILPSENVVPTESVEPTAQPLTTTTNAFDLSAVPAYSGNAYVAVNGNTPYFAVDVITPVSVEYYSELDELGRCGVTYACVGQDLMPTEERGSIGSVKPTGWHTVKYDNVDGKYLYNRCHLIGYQLSGENANEQNLITGTRYLNIEGMLPFENMIADYVKETDNHVAYRVTPIFDSDNLLASGVLMEGYSIEDNGDGICFCVYAYNVQPDIEIDYATGESKAVVAEPEPTPTPTPTPTPKSVTYILNTSTKKFHYPTCGSVKQMKESNKWVYSGSRSEVTGMGYVACKKCNP